ncbi:MAG: hypothetical protein AAF551_15350 [Bacteroidota bacterium]
MDSKKDESEEFKDELITSIVKKSGRRMPNPDFENQMMLRIQRESAYKKEVSSQLKISERLFQGALLAAVGLTLTFLLNKVFTQYGSKTIAVLVLFAVIMVGVLYLHNYRRLIKKYS